MPALNAKINFQILLSERVHRTYPKNVFWLSTSRSFGRAGQVAAESVYFVMLHRNIAVGYSCFAFLVRSLFAHFRANATNFGIGSTYKAIFILFIFISCASQKYIQQLERSYSQGINEVIARLEKMENTLKEDDRDSPEALRPLQEEIINLKISLKELSAQLNNETDKRKKNDINLDSQIALLTDEIREFENRVNKHVSLPKDTGKKSTKVTSTLEIRNTYNEGKRHFNQRKYKEAIAIYSKMNSPSLNSDLADNAQYWIGECWYNLEEYTKALESFTKVFKFKKTNKDDDAQIKIAYCYIKLKNNKKAQNAFSTLITKYPYSEYRKDAENKLKRLE